MAHRTDWFYQAGFGVFVHYLNGLQNNAEQVHSLGRQTSWDECVREFDTKRFAETMHEVGAGYVVFTVMQITRFMIAPNETFDRITGYKPGEACATRDLIDDLYQSLSRYNIPLMLYYTGDGPRGDPKAAEAFGWQTPVTHDFVRKWAAVAAEYGERYREKVRGWWVDGCYRWLGYNDDKLAILAEGLRAGYPDRIIAFNPGVEKHVSPYSKHEDYTCGEQNRFLDMPPGRFVDGEQWHLLAPLGPTWAQPGMQCTKRELAEYVFDVHQRGGVVSIDVLLFRDGTLDRSQIEVLKAIRHELDHGAARPPIPPGNLAYRKPARLLSLDGSHELEVNAGIHSPRRGVDGRLDTIALAGGEWPWTYEVDLVNTVALRRIKVSFGSGYATHFEIRVSRDGENWEKIAEKQDHDGSPFEVALEAPVTARYIRVLGIKPDGPNQPGGQMSIAELEAYE
ncbi:MAG: discoidin domain-containing protein [Armatimonadetes bacterium]|nr:discoidin domain-containing protein [Armatimonadota bacterium]